jgi:hypothetical protein
MSLRQEQSAFGRDLVDLLQFITELGFDWVLGEVERPVEMQRIYVQTGRSKTMEGYHLKRLAADIHVFDRMTGEYILDEARLKPIGEYWERLNPKNSWGGNWKSFKDRPHFERRA